jgi:hypothetical protein
MEVTRTGEAEVGHSPTDASDEPRYQNEQNRSMLASMDAGLQPGNSAPDPGAVRQAHTCMYCRSLLDCPDAFQDPHAYLFHEGASHDSPTALRFSCLLCSTALTWERAGHAPGWK